jgi:hypothetical protein
VAAASALRARSLSHRILHNAPNLLVAPFISLQMKRLSFPGCLLRQRVQLGRRRILCCRQLSSKSSQQPDEERSIYVNRPSTSKSSSSSQSSSPDSSSLPSNEPLPLRRSMPSRFPSSSSTPGSATPSSPPQQKSGSKSRSRPPYVSKSKGPEYFVDIGEDGLPEYPEREYNDPRLNSCKGAFTPLAEELHEQIKVRGPLSVFDFTYQQAAGHRRQATITGLALSIGSPVTISVSIVVSLRLRLPLGARWRLHHES